MANDGPKQFRRKSEVDTLDSVTFWDHLGSRKTAPALIDSETGVTWTYADLDQLTEMQFLRRGGEQRSVVLLVCGSQPMSLIAYLGLLRNNAVLMLYDLKRLDQISHFLEQYRPDFVFFPNSAISTAPADFGYRTMAFWNGFTVFAGEHRERVIAPQLALCMVTSGSISRPKVVQLSRQNLIAMAQQVRSSLQLQTDDRVVASLPITHIYGFSIAHAAFASGASVITNCGSCIDRQFWARANRYRGTLLPGVSWTYQTMRSLAVDRSLLSNFRGFTHAGSALNPTLRHWMIQHLSAEKSSLFFMYGQTEAGGRISVLPPQLVIAKPDSVGLPVEGGGFELSADSEILYRGPNVMLGYATSDLDFGNGDVTRGALRTGDLGEIDKDGFLWIRGRVDRLVKILGIGINLDELELSLADLATVAAFELNERVVLIVEGLPSAQLHKRIKAIMGTLQLPISAIHVRSVRMFPRTAAGKTSYADLEQAR